MGLEPPGSRGDIRILEPFLPPGALARDPQPSVATGDLVLRPWGGPDAPAVARAYQDPQIMRWHCRSMNEAEAEAWIASRRQRWQDELGADWAVTRRDRLVGRTGLRRLNLAEGWGEVAYWVVPTARGQGIASRALCAVVRWAFEDVGLHRLELAHSVENFASCRVAASAGFRLEGTKRQQGLHADGWHDMHLHSLLDEDLATATP